MKVTCIVKVQPVTPGFSIRGGSYHFNPWCPALCGFLIASLLIHSSFGSQLKSHFYKECSLAVPLSDIPQASRTSLPARLPSICIKDLLCFLPSSLPPCLPACLPATHPSIHFYCFFHPLFVNIMSAGTEFILFSSLTTIPDTKEMPSSYKNLRIWGMGNT